MSKRVLVSASHFDTLCKDACKILEDNDVEIVFDAEKINHFPAYSFEELQNLLPEIDACIVGLDDYNDPRVWEISERLKGVCKFGVGVDNFNLEAAAKKGKYVANCPGGNSNSVAELTVMLIIGVMRSIAPLDEAMKRYEWPRFIGEELEGRTVGLYGFGAIARLVAKKLQNFDVKIIAYDPYPNKEAADELNVKLVSEDDLLKESDILSLHAPATKENYHMFCKETISRMKDGVYLINAARGTLVDLDDLADALNSGKIKGAALDAFEGEGAGFLEGQKIMGCKNIILTPHTGAETSDAYRKVGLMSAYNILDIVNGKPPRNWANKKYFNL